MSDDNSVYLLKIAPLRHISVSTHGIVCIAWDHTLVELNLDETERLANVLQCELDVLSDVMEVDRREPSIELSFDDLVLTFDYYDFWLFTHMILAATKMLTPTEPILEHFGGRIHFSLN